MRRTESIRLRLSDEEYEIIRANAESCGMKVAPYIRMIAQNPNIIDFDYSDISEHTNLIKDRVNTVNQIIFTISVVGDYLQKGVDGIKDYTEEILDTEKKLLETVRKQGQKLYKQRRVKR